MRTTGLLIGLLLCCACGKLSTLRKPPTSVDVIESAWKSARYQEPRAEARRAVAKSDYVAAEAAFKRGLSLAEANQDWGRGRPVQRQHRQHPTGARLARRRRRCSCNTPLPLPPAITTMPPFPAAAITLANLHLAQKQLVGRRRTGPRCLETRETPINPRNCASRFWPPSPARSANSGAPRPPCRHLQLCIEQAQASDADALLAKAKGSLSPAPIASTNQSLEAEFWDPRRPPLPPFERLEPRRAGPAPQLSVAADGQKTRASPGSMKRFTRLAIGRRKWDEAARWLALANHSQRSLNSGVDWVLSVLDGQIAEGKGDTTQALHSYRTAWRQAKIWRRGAAAQEDALVNTEVQVQQAAEGFLRLAGRQLQLAKPQPGKSAGAGGLHHCRREPGLEHDASGQRRTF